MSPLGGGGIKRWCSLTSFCLSLSLWRLSVAYIGPKSRTERPRKTKIGTEVAHVTRDSDTTFKVRRKIKITGGGGILWQPPTQLVTVDVGMTWLLSKTGWHSPVISFKAWTHTLFIHVHIRTGMHQISTSCDLPYCCCRFQCHFVMKFICTGIQNTNIYTVFASLRTYLWNVVQAWWYRSGQLVSQTIVHGVYYVK